MPKKERPRAIQLARKRLEKALKELGVVERDLAESEKTCGSFYTEALSGADLSPWINAIGRS